MFIHILNRLSENDKSDMKSKYSPKPVEIKYMSKNTAHLYADVLKD